MSEPYVALMASLPALGPILAAKHPPINRLRLEARLRWLSPDHRAELEALSDLLSWRRLPLDGTDAAFVARARRVVAALTSPTLAAYARDRLELRTIVAALRRRHAGEDPPPPDVPWGYGRYVRRIRSHWRDPEFGLGRAFVWLPAARAALDRGDAATLERILLDAAWAQLSRHGEAHRFDFEAVALYALRWKLLERWTRYDAEAAARRFDALAEAALAPLPETLGTGCIVMEPA